jgi:hypothetical protein
MSASNNRVLTAAAAAPLALCGFALLLALGVPSVSTWFWPAPTTNLAEAAAMGDAARVRALAAAGMPLDVPLPVRSGLFDEDEPIAPVMTPLEAAIRRRGEDSIVAVLFDLGARPGPDEARQAYCLARELGASDAITLLDTALEVVPDSCGGPPVVHAGQ